ATCELPGRVPDVMIAAAPTPSASVDAPTSAVSIPQMTKSTPSRSTWEDKKPGFSGGGADRHAHFDADRCRGVWGAHAEAEARAVGDAGRHGDADLMPEHAVARSAAVVAPLGPRLAAAAAARARAADGDVDGHREAAPRLALRHADFGRHDVRVGAL